MNWASIQAAVKAAVVGALGLPPERVQWVKTAQAGRWRNYPCVDLVLKNPVGVGTDSFIRTDTNTGDVPLTITQVGARQFQVDIRIETTDQTPGVEATGQLASNLRTRLRRPALLALLSKAGVSLATIGATVDADFDSDDRTHSLSVTSVVWNAAETDVDTTDVGEYFDTVEISSDTLKEANGSEAPNQVDLVVTYP